MVPLLAGCGQKETPESVSADADLSQPREIFLLEEVPEGVKGLNAGLADVEPGGAVLVAGRVGGSLEPLSGDFAGFVMADEDIVFCDEMGEKSHCPTPWDACCEDPEKIAASRAFVQFVDEYGAPLQVNLREAAGLKENDQVVVKGFLSADSTPDNRIIIAQGIAIGI